MSLEQRILNTTNELLAEHGLYDWTVKLTQAYREMGKCDYGQKMISISLKIANVSPWDTVINTIRHEVAHAIAGPGTGHGWKWREIARDLGIKNPSPYGDFDAAKIDPWVGECSNGHTTTMARAPQRVRFCGQCMTGQNFDPQHIFQWKKNGRTIPMPKKYQREMQLIMAREERQATVQASHDPFLERIDELVAQQKAKAAQRDRDLVAAQRKA